MYLHLILFHITYLTSVTLLDIDKGFADQEQDFKALSKGRYHMFVCLSVTDF